MARGLCGSLGDLRCAATFVEETGVPSDEREEEEAYILNRLMLHFSFSSVVFFHFFVCLFVFVFVT